MSLTDKQKAFVREYLIDSNGTQAAIRAGYSENSARQIADQLKKDEKISKAIEEARNEKNELATENLRLNIEIKKLVLEKMKKGEPVDDLLKKIFEVTPDDLYFMYSETLNLVKIGRSINPESRLKAIQSGLGIYDLQIIKTLPQEGYREKEFHNKYKSINDRFQNNGIEATEWFKLTPELMVEIWES